MKYTYNDIWNTNNKKDETDASIIKIIRPGSDEYDDVHDVSRKSDEPNYYDDLCNKILKDDEFMNKFIPIFMNKVNEMFISGKLIPVDAYRLYNAFRNYNIR